MQAAGAASIIAWGALLLLSAPLAITFAALGVRHHVAGGASTYVREGLGDDAAAVGLAMFAAVMVANVLVLRVSSGFQLGLSSVLIVVMAVAISVALPPRASAAV